MPYLTVNLAPPGTPLANGEHSTPGHMFYTLTENNGESHSYGFAPLGHGTFDGLGDIKRNDKDDYSLSLSPTIEISQKQYDDLEKFGNHPELNNFDSTHYNALTNNCIQFTWSALEYAGMNEVGYRGGIFTLPISSSNVGAVLLTLALHENDWSKVINDLAQKIQQGEGLLPPDEVQKYHLYDPIVLDLDGNGITTSAVNKDGAMFDHAGTGIRTATGWIAATDGILAIDRNGDGKITNGTEIFGDSYTLKDGTKATNGYQALAEFDSNHDGKISAEDQDFNKLKVWKDLNQDGIGQDNELFTLDQLGVKSLSLTNQNTNIDLGNGNNLVQTGTYETVDGQTKTMGDANFDYNSVFSSYVEQIQLTPEQMKAANLQGTGRLSDLRVAAALSPELATALKNYSIADTKAQQLAMLDNLIMQWARTDPTIHNSDPNDAPHLSIEAFRWEKTKDEGIGLTPGQEKAYVIMPPLSDEAQRELIIIDSLLPILNSFTGSSTSTLYYKTETDIHNIYIPVITAYSELKESIYEGLLYQTRLHDYFYDIGINLNATDTDHLYDYTNLTAKFKDEFTTNPEKALGDLADMLNHHPTLLDNWQQDGLGTLSTLVDSYLNTHSHQELTAILDPDDTHSLGLYFGSNENDNLTGTTNNDILVGGAGDDILVGYAGNDILNGGDGNDTLKGGDGYDVLTGGKGNDTLQGGDWTADKYVFHAGDGQDVINDLGYDWDTDYYISQRNEVVFEGAKSSDAQFIHVGNDLVIKAYGSDDSVTLTNFFDTSQHTRAFSFTFDDKTLSLEDVSNNTITVLGDASDNTLHGWNGNDIIIGNGGNDTIYGGSGSDTLVFKNLSETDATGGNGTTTWKDITLGDTTTNAQADKIDLSSLLVGYTGDKSVASLTPYLTAANQDSNTVISIDRDGAGDKFSSTVLLTLVNTTTSVNDLVMNHQLVI